MKYTYYSGEQGEREVGFFLDGEVVPIRQFADRNKCFDVSPEDMIRLDDSTKEEFEQLYTQLVAGKITARRVSAAFKPLVLNEKANVFCVGRNYRSVAEDMNRATNKNLSTLERPAFFYKPNRAVIATGDSIEFCAEDTHQMDYEGEIAVIIGKTGKDISREDAPSYIYGYAVANDVSARDAMKAYYQMYKGKSMDTFAPIGPCIATAKEVPDYHNMTVETRINGQLRQTGNSSDMLFDFGDIIYYLSKNMTLMPGDFIFTGTPAGIGAAMDPPCFLRDGDKIEISVSNVGTLMNTVHEYKR